MDEFLVPNESFKRLYKEYKLHGSLVIGFDHDSTVFDYHKKGVTHHMVHQLLRDLKRIGCKLICWTATGTPEEAINYHKENDIPCDGLNIDGIKLDYETRKPFFSALLDDRAGLIQVYSELRLLVDLVDKDNVVVPCESYTT